MTPAMDSNPPVLHLTDEYEQPEPLDGTINTAGAEDSTYFAADTDTLYFWFTPDTGVPVEEQVIDPSTGIFKSVRNSGSWTAPEKIWVFDVMSLEGCAYVRGNTIWYCAAVCGMTGLHHFYSQYEHSGWTNGKLDEVLNHPDYQIGEFHITADSNVIFYHSDRTDGVGGRDLWKVEKNDNKWGAPEEVVSQLAGEPTLDPEGNVYFTHHYYVNDQMIEADIYIVRRKQ